MDILDLRSVVGIQHFPVWTRPGYALTAQPLAQLPNGLTALDSENNVEIVRIANPPGGIYRVQVVATNILKGPQDYALVVTGALNPVKIIWII